MRPFLNTLGDGRSVQISASPKIIEPSVRMRIRYSPSMSCMALRQCGCTNMHGEEQVSTIGVEII